MPGTKSLRQIQIGGVTLMTLAGDAAVKQGNTIIKGDSIVVNQAEGIAEVFGNVHINDADSVHTYAQYLKYLGQDRIAYLKKNVKLTDGKGVLLTDDLEYNLSTGIATYKGGGKVINGKTVLTSSDAIYYSDTKDVYFKKSVQLVDPKYTIDADSLLYNTQIKEAHFIAPTKIKTKAGVVINTKNGIYNLETGESSFYDRTALSDSTMSIVADKIFSDEKTGIAIAEGRAKFVDSVNKFTVIGNKLEIQRNENSFLATKKPVMILYSKGDSTFIAADTLFSGIRKYDSKTKTNSSKVDTLKTQQAFEFTGSDSSLFNKPLIISTSDSIKPSTPKNPKDNKQVQTNTPDSIRYFLGFHNVRIFNDSLQAVSDSMYLSTEDSVFRLYKNPVFWNNNSQVSGDTMYLFTQSQKPKRLYVYYNAIVINKENDALYNQISGRTLNAYFENGNIDYIRVKGTPAESIYYPQDEDSAYIGMNKSTSDVIDVHFLNKSLNKIKFINKVDNTLFPFKFITDELKYLKGFLWQDNRRPKHYLELFE